MCIISSKKLMKEIWDNRQYEKFRWFILNDICGFKTDVIKEFSKSDVSLLKIKDVFKCGGRKLEKDLIRSDVSKFHLWLEVIILVTQGNDTTALQFSTLKLTFFRFLYFKTFTKLLGWPKSSFGFFHNILQKNPNELFGQPNILTPSFQKFWSC